MKRTIEQLDAYLVGGAVRDDLLGRVVTDRDWVVVGSSVQEMLALGFLQVGRDFPVFLHPQTNEEYALARTERKTAAGHQGFVVHAGQEVTLEQDLARRDLTVNAIAQTQHGELIDPYGGAADLANGVLRHVSPAFREDPLRVFRAARFAAQLSGFEVAAETLNIMRELAAGPELGSLSAERVWQETAKAMRAVNTTQYFKTLERCGALTPWFVELRNHVPEAAWLDGQQADPPMALETAWALVCGAVSADAANALGARLRAPKACLTSASQLLLWGRQLSDWRRLTAAELVAALQSMGAFKPGAWPPPSVAAMQRRYDCSLQDLAAVIEVVVAAVSSQSVLDDGFSGKAIGDELTRRRALAFAPYLASAPA